MIVHNYYSTKKHKGYYNVNKSKLKYLILFLSKISVIELNDSNYNSLNDLH